MNLSQNGASSPSTRRPAASPEIVHRRTARGERGNDKVIGLRSQFWKSEDCRDHYRSLRTGRERRIADRYASHLPADDRDLRRVLFHADPAAAKEGEGSARD